MKWYLLRTRPRQEHRVENNLRADDVVCYNPKFRKKVQRLNKTITITEPLFPQYVFIKISLEENYQKIKYTRGVAEVVNFGMGPVTVSEKIIERIKSREIGGYVQMAEKRIALKKGERIRRLSRDGRKDLGPIFERSTSNGERIFLLLSNIM